MDQFGVVGVQAAVPRAAISCQTAKRPAIWVRHGGALSRCLNDGHRRNHHTTAVTKHAGRAGRKLVGRRVR